MSSSAPPRPALLYMPYIEDRWRCDLRNAYTTVIQLTDDACTDDLKSGNYAKDAPDVPNGRLIERGANQLDRQSRRGIKRRTGEQNNRVTVEAYSAYYPAKERAYNHKGNSAHFGRKPFISSTYKAAERENCALRGTYEASAFPGKKPTEQHERKASQSEHETTQQGREQRRDIPASAPCRLGNTSNEIDDTGNDGAGRRDEHRYRKRTRAGKRSAKIIHNKTDQPVG
ncbi:hypothetical protein FISHEDRAFT_61025 [Fistulina hepatica ATCC 64428]|uniref:Uncharacterized protein n=1 Tax=Fistulina hepatica ATCC 64428 TaxID=1128425 RepID=A0A0D7A5G6_9AGAR|nr:hypothetical protein FISHEDRAFT_61025 [Fistulina hepatica ATCC 64428]